MFSHSSIFSNSPPHMTKPNIYIFTIVFLLFCISDYYVVSPEQMSSENMSIKSEEKHWQW